MLNFSHIAYERNREHLLKDEECSGTLISFTKIHATRQGYPNPLLIGLVKLDDTGRMVHCQVVDNQMAIKCGVKVRLVKRQLIENQQSAQEIYVLKADWIPARRPG